MYAPESAPGLWLTLVTDIAALCKCFERSLQYILKPFASTVPADYTSHGANIIKWAQPHELAQTPLRMQRYLL